MKKTRKLRKPFEIILLVLAYGNIWVFMVDDFELRAIPIWFICIGIEIGSWYLLGKYGHILEEGK